MKIIICVEVDEFDIDFMGAAEVIQKMEEYISKYGDTTYFCLESRRYDDNCQYIAVKIKRLETDEEECVRKEANDRRVRYIYERERAEYERLSKKFEVKNDE